MIIGELKVKPTRYAPLGYACIARGCWQFVDENSQIGPQYASERELLADVERFYHSRWNAGPRDIAVISEYGLTQKLSQCVRCF